MPKEMSALESKGHFYANKLADLACLSKWALRETDALMVENANMRAACCSLGFMNPARVDVAASLPKAADDRSNIDELRRFVHELMGL
jgi:hypothetical protein